MGGGQVSGLEQARICLAAMNGQDLTTRVSLIAAAWRYSGRDLAGSAGQENSRARSRASSWVQVDVGERAECVRG